MPAYPKPKPHRKKRPWKNPSHLDLVRSLPCLLSGRPAEACHVRYADAKYGKRESGLGRKPDDKWTVPLSPDLHRLANASQHAGNERKWWEQFGVDPLEVAKKLWGKNRVMMERIVDMYRPRKTAALDRIAAILRGEK